jgi:hypothetical protein
VLPILDFMMLSGDVGEKQLMKMDKYIRGRIDELLKVRGLPVECYHASWRDGGLSYPSLVDRQRVLTIRSWTQVMISKNEKVRKAMRWFTESEREYRIIEEDRNAQLLNWKKEKGRREKGTGSIIARARNTCYKLDSGLKMNGDEMTITSGESKVKNKNSGRYRPFPDPETCTSQEIREVNPARSSGSKLHNSEKQRNLKRNSDKHSQENQMHFMDLSLWEELTVYRPQPIYRDGLTIEAVRTVQNAVKRENRGWHTF